MGRFVERVQVDVLRSPIGIAQLAARERERCAQLDHCQHAALHGLEVGDRCVGERRRAAEVRRRMLPAVRSGEVDQLARSERGRQALTGLVVDEAPARLGVGRTRAAGGS